MRLLSVPSCEVEFWNGFHHHMTLDFIFPNLFLKPKVSGQLILIPAGNSMGPDSRLPRLGSRRRGLPRSLWSGALGGGGLGRLRLRRRAGTWRRWASLPQRAGCPLQKLPSLGFCEIPRGCGTEQASRKVSPDGEEPGREKRDEGSPFQKVESHFNNPTGYLRREDSYPSISHATQTRIRNENAGLAWVKTRRGRMRSL